MTAIMNLLFPFSYTLCAHEKISSNTFRDRPIILYIAQNVFDASALPKLKIVLNALLKFILLNLQ